MKEQFIKQGLSKSGDLVLWTNWVPDYTNTG